MTIVCTQNHRPTHRCTGVCLSTAEHLHDCWKKNMKIFIIWKHFNTTCLFIFQLQGISCNTAANVCNSHKKHSIPRKHRNTISRFRTIYTLKSSINIILRIFMRTLAEQDYNYSILSLKIKWNFLKSTVRHCFQLEHSWSDKIRTLRKHTQHKWDWFKSQTSHFSISDDISCASRVWYLHAAKHACHSGAMCQAENLFVEQDRPKDICLKVSKPGVSLSSFSIQ